MASCESPENLPITGIHHCASRNPDAFEDFWVAGNILQRLPYSLGDPQSLRSLLWLTSEDFSAPPTEQILRNILPGCL